ncbi:glycosyltransferase family 2 protein [Haloflavibacter putidus]|uniref:Glycosyltransferase family 2 protein n=1 Tax=Haloflavibacter putidus TaxID=2576776 RepID=A0A507ZA26_9FLAO|nr:glycosyltransferase family 2 protein [Haloflavibacter putidus]TQD33817.1 glycosyltransferase family 2 protein [Haloflavibacter putidus]
MKKSNILLSVCMITYNHEAYIKQAIESIKRQKVDFDFELVISNDCSTDKTHQEILKSTASLPQNIQVRYFNQKENLGMFGNFTFALKECRGKYISFCEGDDYWLDDYKIAKQVDFLEKNKAYSLITGGIKEYHQDSSKVKYIGKKEAYTFTYKDMIVRNHCHTCSTTIRNFIKYEENFQLYQDRGSDSQVWLRALGKEQKGWYSNETFALYRRHEGGVSIINDQENTGYENRIKACKRKINKAEFWNTYFDESATSSVLKVKKKMYKRMFKTAWQHKKYFESLSFLAYLLTIPSPNDN